MERLRLALCAVCRSFLLSYWMDFMKIWIVLNVNHIPKQKIQMVVRMKRLQMSAGATI